MRHAAVHRAGRSSERRLITLQKPFKRPSNKGNPMAKRSNRLTSALAGIPATLSEADTLLGEIGTLQRQIDRIELDLSEAVAAAKKASADQAKPLAEQIKAKVSALCAFLTANRDTVIPAGRKSVSVSQGVMGFRLGNPTVKVAKGQDDAVIATLARLELTDLLRQVVEIDKEAILRNPAAIAGLAGIGVEQVETFYVKPLDVSAEQSVTTTKVTDPRQLQPADAA
jgi:phage host-nuclease inhibitor protein Gam